MWRRGPSWEEDGFSAGKRGARRRGGGERVSGLEIGAGVREGCMVGSLWGLVNHGEMLRPGPMSGRFLAHALQQLRSGWEQRMGPLSVHGRWRRKHLEELAWERWVKWIVLGVTGKSPSFWITYTAQVYTGISVHELHSPMSKFWKYF